MDIFIRIAQLLLSLSILVLLHEMGHFVAARIFKTRVEKFYLFFNPWFSIFKFKKGDTEYGIGWLPLGGYVKIAGMIDESMDKEQMKQPPKPDEFRSKKAWQRLIIMIGGVVVNVLLAYVIYIFMLTIWGEQYLPNKNVKDGIAIDPMMTEIGLQNGDKILKVDGEEVVDFFKIPTMIMLETAESITVERNNEIKEFAIDPAFIKKIMDEERANLITPRIPMIIREIPDTSININSGMQVGDKIIGIDSSFFNFHDEFKAIATEKKGKQVELAVLRNTDTLFMPVLINDDARIEVILMTDLDSLFGTETKEYTFFEAIPAGFKKTWVEFENYIKQFRLIFNKDIKGYENVGSFISIGKIFPTEWNWYFFWRITAFLSIMLAFLNILPIPALDGGHVMFLIIEIIIGRKLSDKTMEIAQYIGFFIVMTLVVLALFNDFMRHVF